MKRVILAIAMLVIGGISIHAQSNTVTTGGNDTGSTGTVSYSIGQVVYEYNNSSTGSVSEGVQQPYEIFITSVKEETNINLEFVAFPNPTSGKLMLQINEFNNETLYFEVYDFNGKVLMSNKIESDITEILLQEYATATYFLRVHDKTKEVKTFKIIKN